MFINHCFKNLVPGVNNVINIVKKKSTILRCHFQRLDKRAFPKVFDVPVAYGNEPTIVRSCAITAALLSQQTEFQAYESCYSSVINRVCINMWFQEISKECEGEMGRGGQVKQIACGRGLAISKNITMLV